MHYKNGREAKNGDKVMYFPEYPRNADTGRRMTAPIIGILYDAVAGNDTCNGRIVPTNNQSDPYPNLAECLHIDDVLEAVDKKEAAENEPTDAPTEKAST